MDEKLNQLKELITRWLQEISPMDEESTDLHVAMWDVLSSVLAERESHLPPLSHISADEVRLVVKDEKTDRVFLRHLPLEYSESSNGVILKGETFAGQPTKIVFLSEFALGKLLELQGQGQDEPVCDGHHSHDHVEGTHAHHSHHGDSVHRDDACHHEDSGHRDDACHHGDSGHHDDSCHHGDSVHRDDACHHSAHDSHDHHWANEAQYDFSSKDEHEQGFYPLLGHDDENGYSMCNHCPERDGCDVSSGEFAKQ